jgi:hypothetical protein
MAWQRNGMGAAWERYDMCELALIKSNCHVMQVSQTRQLHRINSYLSTHFHVGWHRYSHTRSFSWKTKPLERHSSVTGRRIIWYRSTKVSDETHSTLLQGSSAT